MRISRSGFANRHIANALNAHYGRWENFWAPGSYSDVQLDTGEDILSKILLGYRFTCRLQSGIHLQFT